MRRRGRLKAALTMKFKPAVTIKINLPLTMKINPIINVPSSFALAAESATTAP
jgi:hypothetical protein